MNVNEMFISHGLKSNKCPLTGSLNCEIIRNFKRNEVAFHVLKWEDARTH